LPSLAVVEGQWPSLVDHYVGSLFDKLLLAKVLPTAVSDGVVTLGGPLDAIELRQIDAARKSIEAQLSEAFETTVRVRFGTADGASSDATPEETSPPRASGGAQPEPPRAPAPPSAADAEALPATASTAATARPAATLPSDPGASGSATTDEATGRSDRANAEAAFSTASAEDDWAPEVAFSGDPLFEEEDPSLSLAEAALRLFGGQIEEEPSPPGRASEGAVPYDDPGR
jgi:hypothetical protein